MKNLLNEYLKLLAERESGVVLGKKWFNLWLLTTVLAATFLSISFSNGSMIYLSEKMNDPFTNWVNISNGFGSDNFDDFREAIAQEDVQQHYGFSDVQSDNYFSLSMLGKDGGIHYLQCRFFERLNSGLVHAILSPENVVAECAISDSLLQDETYGFVLTRDVLYKLGYTEDSIPAYINYLSFSRGADSCGVHMIEGDFAAAPVPVLGVVRRLPMNMDIIAAKFFYEQYNNDNTYPLNLNNIEYQRKLLYYIDPSVADFEEKVSGLVPDTLKSSLEILEDPQPQLQSWKPGKMMSIYIGTNESPLEAYQELNVEILKTFPSDKVIRLYDYNSSDFTLSLSSFVSVNFNNLDSIRAFEKFAKEQYNVQIEMSQVNSKENFNAVSVMANILSLAMIVFSIICIIMFIVNMLQSYFQKVKHNLGTFKAFGMGSDELIRVYVLILLAIVVSAVILALGVAWLIQLLLPIFGVLKDGEFNYLSLWSIKTLLSIIIVIVATVATVRVVMSKLLKQTPGDLIYDRD